MLINIIPSAIWTLQLHDPVSLQSHSLKELYLQPKLFGSEMAHALM